MVDLSEVGVRHELVEVGRRSLLAVEDTVLVVVLRSHPAAVDTGPEVAFHNHLGTEEESVLMAVRRKPLVVDLEVGNRLAVEGMEVAEIVLVVVHNLTVRQAGRRSS